jgi:hypothetical protein
LQDKWKSLNELTNDPSAYMELDLGEQKTNADASDNQAPVIVRNIHTVISPNERADMPD